MKNKTLAVIAILCAPFLYIDFLTSIPDHLTWLTGLFGFIYMAGWMCSLWALNRTEVLGKTKFSKIAFAVQFTLLMLAQCWNVWVMIGPSYNNIFFKIVDMCWPLSNIWMIVIGITTLKAKTLTGWKRFVPITAGLWFPLMVIPAITIGTTTTIAGIYSALAFMLLGLVAYNEESRMKYNGSYA